MSGRGGPGTGRVTTPEEPADPEDSDPRETGADSRAGGRATGCAPAAGASPSTRPVAAMSVAVERVWRDIVLLVEPWTSGESTGVTYATLLTLVTRYS